MRTRLQHLTRDERGMTFVYTAMSFMAFMAATTLAIDVGMIMTARSQAQNAADAGALAGAVALGLNDFNNRTPSGPAVQSAINAATSNDVMGQPVSVWTEDVTFPVGPTGLNNRVQVVVHRSEEHGNSLATLIGTLFDIDFVDVRAVAVAEASPADAMTCVKPFIIPDRWREPTGQLATQSDTFEMFDNHNQPLPNPDVYVPSGPNYTGYNNEADRGTLLTIRAGSGHNINPTFYFSLALAGVTGGDEYEWNIGNCNTYVMRRGEIVIQEPGNMVGPTVHGAEDLIARDPNAHWSNGRVVSDYGGQSPRVFPIPLYDPIYYAEGKTNGRFADFKVANWIGFFLETVSGNEIYGRIIPIAGIATGEGPAPENAFPVAIRLVG